MSRLAVALAAATLLAGPARAQSRRARRASLAQRPQLSSRIPGADPGPGHALGLRARRRDRRPTASSILGASALLPEGGYLVTERPGRLRVVAADGSAPRRSRVSPRSSPSAKGASSTSPSRPASPRTASSTGATPSRWPAAGPHRRGPRPPRRGSRLRSPTCRTSSSRTRRRGPPTTTARASCPTARRDSLRHHRRALRPRRAPAAQDLATTYGKVVRVNPDGTPPADNPFAGARTPPRHLVLGHRNIQAAALHADRPALDGRARPPRRRRTQPHRAGQELRLAGHHLRRELRRPPVGEGITPARGMEQPATTGTR